MAITHVQDAGTYSGANASVIIHLTTNTTATNALVAAFCLPANASVVSVVDTNNNRWIQGAYASNANGGVEAWIARGIQGGNASVTAIFSAASVGTNVSEWSQVWGVSPTDTWSQTFSTSASVTPQQVSPRTTGDVVITIGNAGASVGGPIGGFTALSVPGSSGFAAAYDILSGSVVPQTHWTAASATPWAAVELALLPINSNATGATTGPAIVNPLLQFPETMVQLSTQGSYLAPLQGIGIWVDVSPYLRSATLGPLGRAHLLDRIQATQMQFTMNNRDGTFNSWNTSSFLYNGGLGLKPMNPIKVTAAWNGVTSPIAYAYLQEVLPQITDVQNVDVNIAATDILAMLSLSYLSSNSYAQAVLSGQ